MVGHAQRRHRRQRVRQRQPRWRESRSGSTTGTPARSSQATTSTRATARRSISETGFNLNVTGNLFMDGGWGKGSGGCGNNCDGAVDLNSSGGFNVPGSRYENQVLVSGNQFVNNWEGIDIWQAGARSCENSGEGWPERRRVLLGRLPEQRGHGLGRAVLLLPRGRQRPRRGYHPGADRPPRAARRSWSAGAVAIDDQIGFARSQIDEDRRPTRTSLPSPARGPSTPRPPASRLRASFASGRRRPGPTAAEATPAPSFPTRGPPRRASPVSRWSEAPGRWPARSGRSSPTRSPPRSATPTTAPHGLSAAGRTAGGRRRGQQRRDLPALRHELGAPLRTPRSRRHFLLGRLPVGGEGHLRDRQ